VTGFKVGVHIRPQHDPHWRQRRRAGELKLVAQYGAMSNTGFTPDLIEGIEDYLQAGAQRLQIQLDHPFDLKPVERALKQRG
jgi:hypothetical protein